MSHFPKLELKIDPHNGNVTFNWSSYGYHLFFVLLVYVIVDSILKNFDELIIFCCMLDCCSFEILVY